MWAALWTHIQKEWHALRRAPGAFLTLLILGVAVGYGIGAWYYSGRLATKEVEAVVKDGQIARYRVALGIDPASKGALIELSNQELAAKAINTAAKLRTVCVTVRDASASIASDKKLTDAQKAERFRAAHQKFSDEFDRTLRADAFNVDNELRRRLDPKAVAAIVGIMPSIQSDEGARLNILTLMPTGMGLSAGWTCTVADGMDQMAKILPTP